MNGAPSSILTSLGASPTLYASSPFIFAGCPRSFVGPGCSMIDVSGERRCSSGQRRELARPTCRSQVAGYYDMFPELTYFERRERRAELRAAVSEVHGIALAALVCVLSGVPAYLLYVFYLSSLGWPRWLETLVLLVVLAMAALVGSYLVLKTRIQRVLRRRLFARGIRLCEQCGYNLYGLADQLCPECGWAADKPMPLSRTGRFLLSAGLLLSTAALVVGLPWSLVSGRFGPTQVVSFLFYITILCYCRNRLKTDSGNRMTENH